MDDSLAVEEKAAAPAVEAVTPVVKPVETKTPYTPKAGDLVFAKVKGYPAWPARVEETSRTGQKTGPGKFPVFFYGTYESAVLPAKDIFPFATNKEKFNKPKKVKFFKEGMYEIENSPDIEPHKAKDDDLNESDGPLEVAEEPKGAKDEGDKTTESVNPVETKALVIDEQVHRVEKPQPKQRGRKKGSKNTPKATPKTPSAPKRASKRNAEVLNDDDASAVVESVPEDKRSRSGRAIKKKKFSEDAGDEDLIEDADAVAPAESVDPVPMDTDADFDPEKEDDKSISKPVSSPAKKKSKAFQNPQKSASKSQKEEKESKSSSKGTKSSKDKSSSKVEPLAVNNAVIKAVDSPAQLTDDEKALKLKAKVAEKEKKKEELKLLKLEKKRRERLDQINQLKSQVVDSSLLRDIETEIMESLKVGNMDFARCLTAMTKLDYLEVTQVALASYPSLLQTIKKCRKFKNDEKVRQKSEFLYQKFKLLFFNELDPSLQSQDSNSGDAPLNPVVEDAPQEKIKQTDLVVEVQSAKRTPKKAISEPIKDKKENVQDKKSKAKKAVEKTEPAKSNSQKRKAEEKTPEVPPNPVLEPIAISSDPVPKSDEPLTTATKTLDPVVEVPKDVEIPKTDVQVVKKSPKKSPVKDVIKESPAKSAEMIANPVVDTKTVEEIVEKVVSITELEVSPSKNIVKDTIESVKEAVAVAEEKATKSVDPVKDK